MWDAIVKIMQIMMPDIVAGLKAIARGRKTKKRRQFASFATGVFVALSDISLRAKRIDYLLNRYINSAASRVKTGGDPTEDKFWLIIRDELREQVAAILSLDENLRRNASALAIITGSTYEKLRAFFFLKHNTLRDIVREIEKGRFPLSVQINNAWPSSIERLSNDNFAKLGMFLPYTNEQPVECFDTLVTYIKSGTVQQNIIQLNSFLDALRQEMGQAFSTGELLSAIQEAPLVQK